ncbi:MAG: hypothetical protein KIT14_07470 [bacterium]|nr:hypothetical protein [bacterium]
MCSSHRRRGIVAVVVACTLALGAGRATAQTCNLNPSGPDQLILTVPGGSGTDFDLGWTGDYHDIEVPRGAQFNLCLNDCDDEVSPECTVQGYAGGQSAVGRSFAPPIPIVIGDFAGCVVTTFQEPFASGTANFATGAIDVVANIRGSVYSTLKTAVCPQCSGSVVGAGGTCVGGARNGQACVTHDVVAVEKAVGDTEYQVSRDCLPTGSPIDVAFPVAVSTGTVTLASTCPGQTKANDCGAGTCTASCTGGAGAGISQRCCSNNTTRRCFPVPLSRSGADEAPSPGTSWPKFEEATLAAAFCAPGAPGGAGLVVNLAAGLPGPATFILPVEADWLLDPSPVATTTTTTLGPGATTTTTLPPGGCTVDADCADTDPCTTDACAAGACSNTRLTGAQGAACVIGDLDPAKICPAIDATLARQMAAALAKARQAAAAADGAPAKKVKKQRGKAKKALKAALAKVKKADRKDKIDDACSAGLQAAIAALQQAVGAI